jgi:hypothetical protein
MWFLIAFVLFVQFFLIIIALHTLLISEISTLPRLRSVNIYRKFNFSSTYTYRKIKKIVMETIADNIASSVQTNLENSVASGLDRLWERAQAILEDPSKRPYLIGRDLKTYVIEMNQLRIFL